MSRAMVLSAMILTACSGVNVAVVTAPPRPTPAAPSAPTEVIERWCEAPVEEVDGSHFFVCGRRAEVRDGRVFFGEDGFENPYLKAVQASEGWVFFSVLDGLVARADAFTDALHPLGRFASGATTAEPSRGRAAFVAQSSLWLSDGRTISRAEVPGAVASAAFSDATSGAAALTDGSLLLSRDGGARWTPVDLGGDRALRVWFDDGLRVRLALRDAMLGADGGLTTVPRAARARDAEASGVEAVQAIVRESGAAFSRIHLGGGAWAALDRATMRVHDSRGAERSYELATERRFADPPMPFARWGDSLAVTLAAGQSSVWHRLGSDGRMSLIFGPGGFASSTFLHRGVVWSDDGRHLARMGPCPTARPSEREEDDEEPSRSSFGDDSGERRDAPPTAMCVLEDGVRRWREVSLPDVDTAGVRWSVAGMHGALALLSNELDATEYAVFDTASGAKSPVLAADSSVHITSIRWARDGSLVGGGERCADGCEPVVLRGSSERPLAVTRAPGAVGAVEFVDADRGLALAPDFTRLWRTRDGGASWEVVASDIAHARNDTPSVVCDPDGCNVGVRMRVRGWGPINASSRTVLATRDAPELGEREAPRASALGAERSAQLRCEFSGASRPSRWSVGEGGRVRAWPDGVAMFTSAGDGARTSWWVAGRHGVTVFPHAADDGSEPPFRFFGSSGATLALSSQAPRPLFSVDGARTTELRDAPFDAISEWGYAATGWQSFGTTDGSSVVSAQLSTTPETTLIAELGERGAVRAWRVFLNGNNRGAIARRGAVTGMYSIHNDGTATFAPLSGDAPVSAPPWRTSSPPCAGRTSADALVLRTASQLHPPGIAPNGVGNLDDLRTVVELSSDGACVRSLSAVLDRRYEATERGRERLAGLYSLHLDAVASDAMTGFADDGRRRVAIRCRTTTTEY